MQNYRLTLRPQSAFATSLQGDTLFGHLCWAIRYRYGEDRLTELLQGYTQQIPFAVVSNVFPQDHIPLPKLPPGYYREVAGLDRNSINKRNWLPFQALVTELPEWLHQAKTDADIATSLQMGRRANLVESREQTHNSINRLTGATGAGFEPYQQGREWFHPDLRWHCYLQIDSERIDADYVRQCLDDIGQIGYGKDASIGMGKFVIEEMRSLSLPRQENANASLTLAPCAPQGMGYSPDNSYYQIFTRFGRHGGQALNLAGKAFKNPVLLARAGALFATEPPEKGFIGQGIGMNGVLSKTLPATVQQGYAPVIAIHLPGNRK